STPAYSVMPRHPPGSVRPTPTSSSSPRILATSDNCTAHSRRRASSLAWSGVMSVSAGPSDDTTMRTWPLCVGCTMTVISVMLVHLRHVRFAWRQPRWVHPSHHLAPPPRTYLLGDADLDPSGAHAFDDASHGYEIPVPAALAMPPMDAVAGTEPCSHASPPRLGQQSSHHQTGLIIGVGRAIVIRVARLPPILRAGERQLAQLLSHTLHLRPQRLVLFAPPLGLGAGGVTLLLQRLDAVQQRQGGLNNAPLIRA